MKETAGHGVIASMTGCALYGMTNTDLFPNLKKLAFLTNEGVIIKPGDWRMQDAVLYVIGKNFGIETDLNTGLIRSFSKYSRALGLQSLYKALDAFHKDLNLLHNEIKTELDKAGFNFDLTNKPKHARDKKERG